MNSENNVASNSNAPTSTTEECHRIIVWGGKVQNIVVNKHSFAWSGRMPCTGIRRCIYCGQPE